MLKQIFIDTETTSANRKRCGLWQLAGIIECGRKREKFDFKMVIFEDSDVDSKAFETNGISLEKISKFADPIETYEKFIKLLDKYVDKYDKKDKFQAIAYGAEFDQDVLRSWFERNDDDFFGSWFFHPWTCVMNLASYKYRNQRSNFKNFKLATVAEYMEICDEKCKANLYHDAVFDIDITYKMYKKLEKQI
jgi:DNA polymerase III subunit epsilon